MRMQPDRNQAYKITIIIMHVIITQPHYHCDKAMQFAQTCPAYYKTNHTIMTKDFRLYQSRCDEENSEGQGFVGGRIKEIK